MGLGRFAKYEVAGEGIVGSYIGAFLANALGIQLGEIFSGWFWGNLIVAAIGAVVLIWALRLVRGR
jgi:uncharacterized membrane protein YeaQ/YmgE (transglycosylase-associated protein family)